MSEHLVSDHHCPRITTSALTASLKEEKKNLLRLMIRVRGVGGFLHILQWISGSADQLISGPAGPPPAAYGLELGGGTHRKSPPSV